jgi:uncharacterized protein YndB with AHSA1/START domain
MEHIEYRTVIEAPAKKVWEVMLQQETYRQWVGKSWPDSFYEGKWEKGQKMKFIGPDGSGTLAELIEVKPFEKVLARHIAILNPGSVEDRTSETAKGWIGTMEQYDFMEQNGKTTLIVSLEITPAWRQMFDEGWPTALQELKTICERNLTTA